MPAISGVTKDASNTPCEALVRVHRRDNGKFVGQAISDATTGAYSIATEDTTAHVVTRFVANVTTAAGDPEWANVLALFHFDTDLNDVKGNSWTAGNSPSITTSLSKFGTGSFNQTGAKYLTRTSAALSSGTSGVLCVECWLYPTAYPDDAWLWSDSSFGFGIKSGKLTVAWPYDYRRGATTVSLNAWHHVAMVKVGSYFYLFLDGVLDLITTKSTSVGSQWYIGSDTQNRLVGNINEFRATAAQRYEVTFTPPSAAFPDSSPSDPSFSSVSLGLHMDGADNSTTFTDVTGKTVTAYGNAKLTTAVKKFGTASAAFDGAGDYLSVPGSSGFNFDSQDFTIDFWINNNEVSATVFLMFYGPNQTWWVYRGAKTLLFAWSTNGSDSNSIQTGDVFNNTGQWYHVSICRSGNMILFYIDGVLVKFGAITSVIYTPSSPTLLIGQYNNSSYFNGYLDDVRITKGVARHKPSFTVPSEPYLGGSITVPGAPTENAQIFDYVTPV